MRLREIDRGDGILNRVLISFISLVSGMRLPDAARVAFYHKDFFGVPMGAWTQAAMRGPSSWSVGERELMAAMVAKWNSCAFCEGAHGAVAAKEIQRQQVDATLSDFRSAPISERLKAVLIFLEIMTLRPMEVTPEHANVVLRSGVSADGLKDAMLLVLFSTLSREMPMHSAFYFRRRMSLSARQPCFLSAAMRHTDPPRHRRPILPVDAQQPSRAAVPPPVLCPSCQISGRSRFGRDGSQRIGHRNRRDRT